MFTGLIEAVGELRERSSAGEGLRLRLSAPFGAELESGESVAVDGVCLTASGADAEGFTVEVGRATLARTTLGDMEPGRRVNLERALRAGDPLGGHLVQGHVDGVGEVGEVEPAGETVWLRVRLPSGVERYTVPRGSLAVDGVSLTVQSLEASVAEVAVIPYTWEHTALDRLAAGVPVNLEADLLGKYVEKLLEPRRHARSEARGSEENAQHG